MFSCDRFLDVVSVKIWLYERKLLCLCLQLFSHVPFSNSRIQTDMKTNTFVLITELLNFFWKHPDIYVKSNVSVLITFLRRTFR
jgi:hypothetical protein